MYKSDTSNYHNDHTYLSASMLAGNGCARQTLWERTSDFVELPRRRFWPFRGSIGHALCEGADDLIAQYGWLQEIRTETTLTYPDLPAPLFDEKGEFTGDFDHDRVLEIAVRGTADAYNPLIRTLADMKSMADKKAIDTIRGAKDGTFSKNLEDSHVWQFNIYRWLLARTAVPDWVRERFAAFGLPAIRTKNFPAPTTLIMQGFSMMELPRSGITYPISARGQTTLYDIDPVPVLPLHEIEAFVRPRALYWYRHLVLKLPAPVLPADQGWMCKNCQFNGELLAGERCHPDAERAGKDPGKVSTDS
jgi:hypothetical protein